MKLMVCLSVCLSYVIGSAHFPYYTYRSRPYYSLGYNTQVRASSSAPLQNTNTFYYKWPALDENLATGSFKLDVRRSQNVKSYLKATGLSDDDINGFLGSDIIATLEVKDGKIKYTEGSDGTNFIDVELEHGKEIIFKDPFTKDDVKMIAHVLTPYTIRIDTQEKTGTVTSATWSFCSGGTYATSKLLKKDEDRIHQAFFYYSREGNQLKLTNQNQQVLCPGQRYF